MNMIKLILNERRCAYLPPYKEIATNQWSELEWKQEHTQPELFSNIVLELIPLES